MRAYASRSLPRRRGAVPGSDSAVHLSPATTGLLQPKLAGGSPGDRYEQEAEGVARRLPGGSGAERGDERGSAAIALQAGSSRGPSGSSIPPLSGGAPLPAAERAYFESRLGWSFEKIRIHDDPSAHAAAGSLGARAFTRGNDIAFARGQYRPGAAAGRRLLAHELTHTVQQSREPAATPAVQADVWDTLGTGWELYWGLDDVGASFARQLMEHYLLGLGTDFDADPYGDPDWNTFMLDRPEIQRAMRPVLEGIASRVAGSGATEQPWIRLGAGPTVTESLTGVRLNELESMRLTLHGCHRIDVEVNYDVNEIEGGREVIMRRINMTWVDVGDMHPGTVTELEGGGEVDDAELTGTGSAYNIFIEFMPHEQTVYHVTGGAVTQVSGWPPVAAAGSGGRRG